MPQAPSPLFEKVALLLERVGAEILNDPTQHSLRAAIAADPLGPFSLKTELVAFSYAVLGLILASRRGGSAVGREADPSAHRVTRALRLARQGDQKHSPHGGIFDGSLFPHLVDPETGCVQISDALVAELFALLTAVAERPEQGSSPALLGELYEALLEFEPELIAASHGPVFRLKTETREHTRRRLGSYYTPDSLIDAILDRVLNPLIALAKEQGKNGSGALLELSLIDPACGAGDFLHKATWRIASALAELETGPDGKAHEQFARVLKHCIFGIDIDPLAREICRLGLWLEVAGTETELTPGSLPIRVGSAILIPPPEEEGLSSKKNGQSSLPYFNWATEFPQVMARGGFDVILGNPPWIAHAGRAAQSLPNDIKAYYRRHAESFSGYPTTHGIFAGTLPRMLRPGGRLGLVLPASVSELDGYAATRRAHDRYNTFPEELVDFGEGQFPGVTQPCMALVSERTPEGRGPEAGTPWPVARPDLDPEERTLLEKVRALEPVPPELFGERGLQSDRTLLPHLEKTSRPSGRFVLPIREGTDVREFSLLPPRFHADPLALGRRLRSESEFQSVRILLRQTARFPIAALSDGLAFRNSLLAGFEFPGWPAKALVPLLNSSFVRWVHFQRFRDARQPILPQVKIGHLRLLPAPPHNLERAAPDLESLGSLAATAHADRLRVRADLDALVFELYGLTAREQALIERWRDRILV